MEELISGTASGWYYLLERTSGVPGHVSVPAARLPLPPASIKSLDGFNAGGACVLNTDAPVWAAAAWGFEVDETVFANLPRHERNRQQAIFELIISELQYTNDLSTVVEAFNPQRCASILSDTEYNTFITPLKELLGLHTPFVEALRERQESSSSGGGLIGRVGDLVLEHIGRLEALYSTYCQTNIAIGEHIEQKREHDDQFRAFMDRCMLELNHLDLLAYRLKPMQRLTKYPLLIEAIERHTPMQHFDRLHLSRALAECVAMITSINERIRSGQLKQQLMKLVDKLVVPPRFKGFTLAPSTVELKKTAIFSRVKLRKTSVSELKLPADIKFASRHGDQQRRRVSLLVDRTTGPFLLISQLPAIGEDSEILLAPRIPIESVCLPQLDKISEANAATDIALEFATPWDSRPEHMVLVRAPSHAARADWMRAVREMQMSAGTAAVTQTAIDEVKAAAAALKHKAGPLTDTERQLVSASQIIDSLLASKRTESPTRADDATFLGRRVSARSPRSSPADAFMSPPPTPASLAPGGLIVPQPRSGLVTVAAGMGDPGLGVGLGVLDGVEGLEAALSAPPPPPKESGPDGRVLHYYGVFCKCRKMTDVAANAERLALNSMCAALDELYATHGQQLRAVLEESCWPRMFVSPHNPFGTFGDMWDDVSAYWFQALGDARPDVDPASALVFGDDSDATFI